jgi:cellulose synthase/poly-beta-1,6-N-acetylglucosamine synthase-like glycosyltransferase
MTVTYLIDAVEFVCLLYFLGLYGGYLMLNLSALFTLPRYMHSRVMGDFPQNYTGFEPPISVLVPAYNEEACIASSIRSLLQLSYPEFELVVLNDGSKDSTLEVLKREFELVPFPEAYRVRLPSKPVRAFYVSTLHPNLRVVDKENGGKADSQNAGINAARYPLFCVIDSDSILQRDSLHRTIQPFLDDPRTIACGGTIRIANGCRVRGGFLERAGLPSNPLALFQVVEYLRAFLFGRLGWLPLNAVMIVSGAFGIFHKETVVSVGGYGTDNIGEDMELILRLHRVLTKRRVPYRIAFVADPVCWTEAPEDLRTLRKQRVRWQHGLGDSISLNRGLLFQRGSGFVGWLALPFIAVFEWLGPLVEVGGYVIVVVAYLLGLLSFSSVLIFFLFAVGFGMMLSVTSLLLEEISFHTYPKVRDILLLFLALIAENIGYRQLNSVWRLEGLVKWMLGRKAEWGEMKRTASWQTETGGEGVSGREAAK